MDTSETKELLVKYQLEPPIKVSGDPSYFEVVFLEHFLNEYLSQKLKTHARNLRTYKHQVHYVRREQGVSGFVVHVDCHVDTFKWTMRKVERMLKDNISWLFEDEDLISVYVLPDYFTDRLTKSLCTIYFPTDLKSELTKEQGIHLGRVWAEILRAVQRVPGIELDETTSERGPRLRRIHTLEALMNNVLPGFVVLETLSIQGIHHDPGIPHESEIEISVRSNLRIRRVESSNWMTLETTERRYDKGARTKRYLTGSWFPYIPGSQHRCMEAITTAIIKDRQGP